MNCKQILAIALYVISNPKTRHSGQVIVKGSKTSVIHMRNPINKFIALKNLSIFDGHVKNLQSILIDRNGIVWPRIIFTSSSFFALPVTKVTGFVNVICTFMAAILRSGIRSVSNQTSSKATQRQIPTPNQKPQPSARTTAIQQFNARLLLEYPKNIRNFD